MRSVVLPLFVLVLAPFAASVATAQEPPRRAVEFVAGMLMFPDGTVREGMAGGSARFYLTPRLAVGPEITFVQGSNHSHVMATANLTFDFLGPVGGREPDVTPFLVAGGGWFHSREQFPGGGFNSGDPAFTAGGGVRAVVAERVFVGAEARIGWELHVRVNGLVGCRF